MGRQIKTKAIVLHEMPIGDYDKRLILLTKEAGKITAFVKGARRPNNKMLAVTQIFAYGDFVLGQGKNSYSVYQATLIDAFHRLRMDVEDMTYGMYMLEFTDFVAKEEEDNRTLMQWLLISLKVLEQQHIGPRLAMRIFELKAMSIIGFTPWLSDCVVCHNEAVTSFSPESGGVICGEGHGIRDLVRLHPGTLYAMGHILSQPMKGVYAFELAQRELSELEAIMTRFVGGNLNHAFKTMAFLQNL